MNLETRLIAAKALDALAEDLGLDSPPTLRWFSEESPEEKAYRQRYRLRFGEAKAEWEEAFQRGGDEVGGLAAIGENVLWLSKRLAEYPVETLVQTLAHELAHFKQPLSIDTQAAEEGAENYASTAVGRLRTRIGIRQRKAAREAAAN